MKREILSAVILATTIASGDEVAKLDDHLLPGEMIAKSIIPKLDPESYLNLKNDWEKSLKLIPLSFGADDFDVVLVSAPNWYEKYGMSWESYGLKKDGACIDLFATEYCPRNKCDYYVHPQNLFIVEDGTSKRLMGRMSFVNRSDSGDLHFWQSLAAHEFCVSKSGHVSIKEHKGGFEEIFADEKVRSAQTFALRYFKVPEGTENGTPGELPRYELLEADSSAKEKLVTMFREKVKSSLTQDLPVTIYAVFADVDNDGECDAYVTSDRARFSNGRYRWYLYLQKKGIWSRCEKTLDFSKDDWLERITVEERVDAAPTDFFFVHRQDYPPTILVTQHDGKKISSCSYLRHTSAADRANRLRPEGFLVFDAIGHLRPHQHRDFSDFFDGRARLKKITRLRCETFLDPKTVDGKGE